MGGWEVAAVEGAGGRSKGKKGGKEMGAEVDASPHRDGWKRWKGRVEDGKQRKRVEGEAYLPFAFSSPPSIKSIIKTGGGGQGGRRKVYTYFWL